MDSYHAPPLQFGGQRPLLIEPGVRSFLSGTLRECRRFKDKHLTLLFNITMTFVFVGLFGAILLFRYKGRPTPSERAAKEQQKYQYVVSKLHQLATVQNAKQQNTFTQLPMFSTP
jgi:hypothetical protein